MKIMNKSKIMDVVLFVCSVVLAVGVMTAFRACGAKDDGSWMHCHHAQMAVFYIGIAMTVLSAVRIFIRGKVWNIVLGVLGIILSVIALLIPGTIIKMCMMNDMRCHAVMTPFVFVMGIISILVIVLNLIFSLVSQRKEGSHGEDH